MGESVEKAGKVGVVSVTRIPRGARSAYLHLDRCSLQDVAGCEGNVQVGIWSNSEIQPLNSSLRPGFWPKLIKLAPDCHAQNVQLSRVNGAQVVLSASKDIPSGAELMLWFDEDILMDEMNIPPYLSPVNIRVGGNSYICNICGRSFQAPNNLKVHIALQCDSLPMSVLWGRLVTSKSSSTSTSSPNPQLSLTLTLTPSHNHNSSSPSHFWSSPLSPSTPTLPLVPILVNGNMRHFGSPLPHPHPHPVRHQFLHPGVTTSSPSPLPIASSIAVPSHPAPRTNGHHPDQGHGRGHHTHDSHPHPPKPLQPSQSPSNSTKTKLSPHHKSHPVNVKTRSTSTSTNGHGHGHGRPSKRCGNSAVEKSISVSVSDPEAQLESIVSNMGKAGNGHMCLYCGKLYSRKYGLKIHIRTHTGYKPLRCRICHRPFGDPSNLNKHIRLHSDGNTPYRCDICHKVLVRKRDLERHIRSRHGNLHPVDVVLPISLQDGISLSRTPGGSGS